jgi:ribosome-binding factor A
MSPDLRTATAYVSVMGSEEERQANLDALESANGYIRRQLKPRLRMRTIPDIVFFDDRSMEYAQTIATVLNSIPASETLADVPPRRQQDDE